MVTSYETGYVVTGLHSIGTSNPYFEVGKFLSAATNELTKAMRREGEITKRTFEHIVENWETYVDFDIEVDYRGDTFSLTVYTNSDIFRFINDGTSIRYATMTKDFIPKTRPGSIISGTGQGGLAFVNKKKPRPGIGARNFVEIVTLHIEPFFFRNMDQAFYRIAELYWDRAFSH